MKNLNPEMMEKAKAAKSAEELSEDELDKVSAGFEPPFPIPAVSTGRTKHYCSHCKKETVFYLPAQGAPYCSVCKEILVDGDASTEGIIVPGNTVTASIPLK